MAKGPLEGVKVVEIAGIGPAPCAGMMLADMGAEVVLVERKVASANAAGVLPDGEGQAIYNRGKRSIAVDLKAAAGVAVVLDLIADADILIEGFRPGVMERLGLGPQVALQRNPKLVYGRLTGWGQTGPLAQAAGHDPNYIALSGALWYGGSAQREPTAPLTLVGDLGGGTMMLLWGVMCALHQARAGGEGQVVDAAITDGSAYLSSLLWMMYNTGQIRDQLGAGWADGAAPWNGTYRCADGEFITLCALEPQFYQELLQRLELDREPLFEKQWDRKAWPEARARLEQRLATQTRDQWCELLEGTDACFAPVLSFAEAPLHPHNVARQTFSSVNGVTQPNPAPKLGSHQPQLGVPPRCGEHSKQVLENAGYAADQVAALLTEGVI
ncbi:CoA transferase [Motiliproteus coralliicola]|uniref:CoA transferase n=1 Tax=Motiliproteus coralliicola TaxID=2283196 RepID=A0A369WS71_9GAMM|nr:CaiB/BaiF CoA-transferase family protein [Motiliproteus coralliicola]RDE24401.1 CoA transferase [Motiliproteus coralliicola]